MHNSQLRAFYHVAAEGGFSRAAAVMGVSQPAVSEQVRKLEQAHDVRLFDRSRKQVRLTPKGRELLAIIRPMFEIEEQARRMLSASRALPAGELRIIADSAHHIAHALRRFRARHAKVRITLRHGNSRQVAHALLSYEADIGVTGEPAPGRAFDSIGLGSAPIIAFAARDFPGLPQGPATLRQLARLPLVLREKGSKTRQKLLRAAREAGLALTPAIEAEGREAVREIVAAGAGVGFVSEAESGADPGLVKIPLRGVSLIMEERLICLSQRRDVPAIRAFMAAAGAAARPPEGGIGKA